MQQLLQTMPEEHVRSYMTGWCIDLLGRGVLSWGCLLAEARAF